FAQVTQSATIATDGQNVQLNFAGEYVRSSAVVGNVVAADAMMSGGDGQPETLAGVTVTLGGEHAMGETMETDMSGGFAFTGLRAGTYTVTISDYPEDISFETVSVEVEIDVGEVGNADFTGHFIRTSAVEGQVIIEGEGLAGITVTLSGGPSDESHTMMTDADGMYRFEDLRPGDYTVSIMDFDPRDYEFAATSQDVSVDLDETGTVSFTGVLLRTSGISGRVSVEGMGLPDIAVTLSGAADASTMTDASGQYAFAGLAAGDYTVTVAVAGDAYVFDAMSSSVMVGDDESVIVNFEGAHATTASVSGMLFFDELDKNDMMDAGEHPLPAPGIPVALVGPGVNDQRLSATGPDGSFMFPGLRAGSYQLVVPIDATVAAALAENDVKYGGPGVGYAFDLDVGEQKTQAVPFDITHTTINVAVTLKGGGYRGDPIPGASVTFYGANNAMVGSGETKASEAGVYASIKVARAGASDNTVHMMVAADDYFVDPTAEMQAVTWDPQSFVHPAAGADPPAVLNDADIVNLNVDVNISGATVMTEYGGGEALAGWEISVMHGEEVVGAAPEMLDDNGMGAWKSAVAADELPATFTITVADDQDDELDGGEMYEASGGMYTHTGLKLAGNQDATPVVVTYTTQTLKVYVHHERDQVRGYTGSVLGGDVRAAELVDLEVRQASGNDGRFTSPISNDDWDSRANTSGSRGAYTFAHLPADLDIVVHATARDGYMLLDLHGLDTYRNMAENGVMGGAFGAMGGWGHTVTLCPLTETEPTGQDFGKCGSFAVVTTHDVSANVSKMRVRKSGAGFHSSDPSSTHESEVTVSLEPVEGKNLAGVGRSFTTAKSDDPTTEIDERRDHDFGTMAAGAYELGLPDGWRAMVGDAAAAGALSPLESDVDLVVTPSTATLYGFVRNADGFGLENVTVTVNGQTATTDDLGRYIVSGISRVRGQLFVNTERAGYPAAKADSTNNADTEVPTFEANTVKQHNFTLSGANNTVAITGMVTESGTGAGIKGVEIRVDGSAPLNAGSGQGSGKLTTEDDGSYTAIVATQPFNDPLVTVTATKDGYHFLPEESPVAAIAGSNPTANFEGRKATEIVGRVTAPGGGMPRSEVTVTARDQLGAKLDEVTTTETGTFSVFVPTLSGTVFLTAEPRETTAADLNDPNWRNLKNSEMYVWFDPPATRPDGSIAVIPGQTLQFGTFQGYSVQPRITSVKRGVLEDDVETADTDPAIAPALADRDFALVKGEPTNVIEVKWEYDTRNASDATDDSYSVASAAAITLEAGTTPTAGLETLPAEADRTERTGVADGTTVTHKRTTTYTIAAEDLANYGDVDVTVGVVVTGNDGAVDAAAATSAPVELAAVASAVTGLEAGVTVTGAGTADDPEVHSLTATWSGQGSPGLTHRIALYVPVNATETTWEWLVFPAASPEQPDVERATAESDKGTTGWGKWSWPEQPADGVGFDINLPANTATGTWPDDDGVATYDITAPMLKAVTHVRVDTRVTGSGAWTKHTPAAISR
ncbi:MAG: carboxypeptidase regulatory-like domain-containing protein, partial [Gammaproteobacteria bacterium]|nr:carboxypeptidase regulatory-like domain-containing protein [Gammaproteobacteria bacterium]